MKILFLTTAHNSLSQRLFIELTELGHIVDVALAISEPAMLDAVGQHAPDLIIAPMLKRKNSRGHLVQIRLFDRASRRERRPRRVLTGLGNHDGTDDMGRDGPAGGGGNGCGRNLGFVQLCAFRLLDCQEQRVPPAGRVTQAAVRGVLEAVEKFQLRQFRPEPLDYSSAAVIGCWRPTMRQSDRADPTGRDSTKEIAGK